jgi:hypothetical protein
VVWLDRARGLTVRIAEDGSFATIDDEPVDVEGTLGIAHVLELSESDVARWSALFADYALLQPFAQLARPVVRDAPIGRVFSPGHVVGLWNAGWQPERGEGGVVQSMVRRFDEGLARAHLSPGLFPWDMANAEPQTLEALELEGALTEIERSEARRELT